LELLCKSNRLPEAAFLARTYLPSHVPRVIQMWKDDLSKTNKKAADSLADPTQYSNLFPDIQEAIKAEDFLKPDRLNLRPAAEYKVLPNNLDRNALEEVKSVGDTSASQNEVAELVEQTETLQLKPNKPISPIPPATSPLPEKSAVIQKPEPEPEIESDDERERKDSIDLEIGSDFDGELEDHDVDDLDLDDLDDELS